MNKQYLGDAVYVEIENGMFKLTTENGINITNEIFLYEYVYRSLVRYADKAFSKDYNEKELIDE